MAEYVKNSILYAEIVKSKEQNRLTDFSWEMLEKIIRGISRKFVYSDNRDRNDCLAHARFVILTNWHKFDPTRTTNAFSFYTQMAKNAFIASWHEIHPQPPSKMVSLDHDNGVFNI